MKKLILSLAIFSATNWSVNAQTITDADFERSDIISNLDTPWEILWGPDDKIWFTERKGTVKRVDPVTKNVETLITISDVYENSESGLLGMTLHPDFTNGKPWVYVVYTYQKSGATNGMVEKLVRYTYQNNQLVSPVVLIDDILANTTHDGSRIKFNPVDKKLYMTTGDAQNQTTPQNTASINGKVLRLNEDGTAATGNPIAGNRMYSFGHRNPQGLAFGNGKVYIAEHGANIEDEINIIEPNRNYGWPNVEGPCSTSGEITFCSTNNVKEPIWSSGSATEAVAGLEYYPDSLPATPLKNSLLMVSLKFNTSRGRDLRVYKLSNDGSSVLSETILLNNTYGRMRDLCVSPAGDIYISTSNQDGRGTPTTGDDRIIKLRHKSLITGLDATESKTLIAHPNPVIDYLSLNLADGETVTISDITGIQMTTQSIQQGKINLSDLPSGLYLIQSSRGNFHTKVLKK